MEPSKENEVQTWELLKAESLGRAAQEAGIGITDCPYTTEGFRQRALRRAWQEAYYVQECYRMGTGKEITKITWQ